MTVFPDSFVTGDEDCLFLNIFRPKMRKRSLLPVVVYLHGGSFRYGSANSSEHGPEYFMETDVILVTVQYRLNIFGFLSSGDSNCPGNFGLKDQVQALRWIRRNIQSFGGNPKSVTLMGHGAGAASVQLHMMSPLSNGQNRMIITFMELFFNQNIACRSLSSRNCFKWPSNCRLGVRS